MTESVNNTVKGKEAATIAAERQPNVTNNTIEIKIKPSAILSIKSPRRFSV